MLMKWSNVVPFDAFQTQFNLRTRESIDGVDLVLIHADELHLVRLDTIPTPEDLRRPKEMKVRDFCSLEQHDLIFEFYEQLRKLDQLLKEMTPS